MFGGQVDEHLLERLVPVLGGDLRDRPVSDDATFRDEHHAVAHALDLDHVVARDEQRGALLLGDRAQAGADAQRDIRIE